MGRGPAAPNRVVERRVSVQERVGVGAAGQQQRERREQLEVERAKQRVGALDRRARVEQQSGAAGIGAFHGVVERFAVVGRGAGIEQRPRHPVVMQFAGGPVQRAEGVRRKRGVDPRLIRIRARAEQQLGAAQEAVRPCRKPRQPRMRHRDEGRHVERAARPVGPRHVAVDRGAHQRRVARGAGKEGIRVDQIGAVFQQARRGGGVRTEKPVPVHQRQPRPQEFLTRRPCRGAGIDERFEIRPGREAVLASDARLRVVESEIEGAERSVLLAPRGGKRLPQTDRRGRISTSVPAQQVSRLPLRGGKDWDGRAETAYAPPCVSTPTTRNSGCTEAGAVYGVRK